MALSVNRKTGRLLADARRMAGRWACRLSSLRRTDARLGIDIGSRYIKVVESVGRASRLRIDTAICFETPATSVVSHSVRDVPAVAAALREHLDAAGVRATIAATCIPGPAAMLKRFKVPIADADRLGAMVHSEVENLASFGSDSLCVDYRVSESADDENLEVLVAAARRETVEGYLDVLQTADIRPDVVDIDYLALANMVDANYGVDPSRTLAFVQVGAELCALGVRSHGLWVFTGNVGIGLDANPGAATTIPGDPTAPSQEPIAQIVGEVDRALRFYWPESAGDRVDEIVLGGGGAQLPELASSLAERVGCTVKPASPFLRAVVDPAAGKDGVSPTAPLFSVAAGLALRSPEEP